VGLCGPAFSFALAGRVDFPTSRSVYNAYLRGKRGETIRVTFRLPLPRTVILFLLALLMIAVQGYHYGVDDAAIYLPAVERVARPELFPYGADFFLSHGRVSIFSDVVGLMVRWLHVPLPWTVLAFHVLGIYLLLLAGYWLAALCFTQARARWAAILALASVLTVPVAGTALPIMDPYLTARSLSTPLTVFALAAILAGRPAAAAVFLAVTALLHPQMAAYGVALVVLLSLLRPAARRVPAEEALASSIGLFQRLPDGFHFGPAQEPYRQTLYSRSFFFAGAWTWFEWAGVVLPLAILFAITRIRVSAVTPAAARLCRALLVLGLISTAAFLLFSSSAYFDDFVRLQPMRSFQLIYIVMFLLLGGLAGEYLLREKIWRWLLLFIPISIGMYCVDRSLYPTSQHLELPGRAAGNAWVQAFQWARDNTPQDAIFALPPRYMLVPGEDTHGFRAIAERSMIADQIKDSGVASVFPQMAREWEREQQLTQGWENYTAPDFRALATRSPVTWVVVRPRQARGLDCPFQNAAVSVCRLKL
jgi:hypothetical protein